MAKMLCSLCRKTKNARPLDLDDVVFGAYVRIIRGARISKHKSPPGICAGCMPAYNAMLKAYQTKSALYLMAAVAAAAIYFALTTNILISLVIAAFIAALSLLSYCPPLKK